MTSSSTRPKPNFSEAFSKLKPCENRSVDEVAQELGVSSPQAGVHNKGRLGDFVEKFVGIEVHTNDHLDFLDGELKTYPNEMHKTKKRLYPKETISIASVLDFIDFGSKSIKPFGESGIYEKIKRTLFVGHIKNKRFTDVFGIDLEHPLFAEYKKQVEQEYYHIAQVYYDAYYSHDEELHTVNGQPDPKGMNYSYLYR